MKPFIRAVREFVFAEDGPQAVEYAIVLALIIVVCITVVGALGKSASTEKAPKHIQTAQQ